MDYNVSDTTSNKIFELIIQYHILIINVIILFFFFFNDTAPTEIYTLSLHDALPISPRPGRHRRHHRPGRCPVILAAAQTALANTALAHTAVAHTALANTTLANTTLADGTPLDRFGTEPWWLILIKAVGVFAFLMVMTLFGVVFERKVVGYMQNRIGPNRVGPWGTLQSLADGLKLAFKEDIIPVMVDKPVYILAPIMTAVPAFLAFCVIPMGPEVSIFGHITPLQLTDLPVGA